LIWESSNLVGQNVEIGRIWVQKSCWFKDLRFSFWRYRKIGRLILKDYLIGVWNCKTNSVKEVYSKNRFKYKDRTVRTSLRLGRHDWKWFHKRGSLIKHKENPSNNWFFMLICHSITSNRFSIRQTLKANSQLQNRETFRVLWHFTSDRKRGLWISVKSSMKIWSIV